MATDADREEIRKHLIRWASRNAERDGLIVQAIEAGISILEISTRMGLTRTTIYRVARLHGLRSPATPRQGRKPEREDHPRDPSPASTALLVPVVPSGHVQSENGQD